MFAEMFAQLGAMPNPISNDEYLARQNKLCQTLDDNDLLILCSSPVTIHSNDVHHPYRTQSNLLYMTGWIEPDAVFCFTNNDGDWESHLFVQPKIL